LTTTNTVPILPIRRRLGPQEWALPVEYGPSGWVLDHKTDGLRIIVTDSPMAEDDGEWWRHASISHRDRMPTYDELQMMHRAVWSEGWAYQVFAPTAHHVNISEFVLHLWGRPDGRRVLPNFGSRGTI